MSSSRENDAAESVDIPAAIVFNLDGTVQYWSAEAALLTGLGVDDAVGRSASWLLVNDQPVDFSALVEALGRGEHGSDRRATLRDKQGRSRQVNFEAGLLLDEANAPRGVCGIAFPIAAPRSSGDQAALLAEAERRYLGRQLHDSFGQQLTGMAMLVASLSRQRPPDEVAGGTIERLASAIEEAKRQLRALINGLTPVAVAADELSAALEELARDTQATYGVPCRCTTSGSASLQNDFAATQVYLIAREAVHNAVKHAQAREIAVSWHSDFDWELTITDDGQGFAGDSAEGRERSRASGLQILRHRCAFLQAELTIESQPGAGTTITCRGKAHP